MFLFEALVSQRAKTLLEEAAVHFISRDRSGLAETLIVPRLRNLGPLTSTRAGEIEKTVAFDHV